MKKCFSLIFALCLMLTLGACIEKPLSVTPPAPDKTAESADPSANLDAPYYQTIPGYVTDIFTEGDGNNAVEIVAVETDDLSMQYFTLTENTVYENYFPLWTGEKGPAAEGRDALRVGARVEIECESRHGTDRHTALTVTMVITISNVAPQYDLTLEDLKALVSSYGEKLTWGDFGPYLGEDIGSGLYIYYYPIDADWCLMMGGASTEIEPMYIRLVSEADHDNYIDVRYESIDEFIAKQN